MFGLIVFGGLFLYFIVSIVIIIAAVNWADKHGKRPGITGAIAALVMFGWVVWDLIPVYAVHAYQCNANAGFTVYKSLNKWKQENPGVAETLVAINNGKSINKGNTSIYPMNQRFVWEITDIKLWHIVRKTVERTRDTKTGEVLAENIDFRTNLKSLAVGGGSNLKFWLRVGSCAEGSQNYSEHMKANTFNQSVKFMGETE